MPKETILIVEGETKIADELQGTLRQKGYEIKEVQNETGALEILGDWKADFVLLAEKAAVSDWAERLKRRQNELITDRDGNLVIDIRRRLVEKAGEEILLTPTEYKLFVTMAKSPNRIFTREQLITYALEDEFQGYDRSIDTYIKELRRKLKEDGRNPRYIHTVHGVGYKFVP